MSLILAKCFPWLKKNKENYEMALLFETDFFLSAWRWKSMQSVHAEMKRALAVAREDSEEPGYWCEDGTVGKRTWKEKPVPEDESVETLNQSSLENCS